MTMPETQHVQAIQRRTRRRRGVAPLAAAVAVLALGVFGVSAASAATLTVCAGGKPKCEFSGVQEAINNAKSGDTIKIAAGTYAEPQMEFGTKKAALEIPGGGAAITLTLQGAGAGKTTIEPLPPSSECAVLTIDRGETVTITGLTITHGSFHGIYNLGTLTLTNSTVIGNSAVGEFAEGGGIFNGILGRLTLNNSTVSDNSAAFGGGIWSNSTPRGAVTVSNSTLSGNTAEGYGGGIFNGELNTLTVSDSTLSGNRAGFGGGGILNTGTLMMNNNSTLSGNTASTGGGMENRGTGAATLNNTTVRENTAEGAGGGIANENFTDDDGTVYEATATLTSSRVLHNTAKSDGGGISNHGKVTMNGTTVSAKNKAGEKGGGIFNNRTVTGEHDVVTGNEAPEGAGIFNEPPGELQLTKSTVQS
jgi:hypothetical protein